MTKELKKKTKKNSELRAAGRRRRIQFAWDLPELPGDLWLHRDAATGNLRVNSS